LVSIIDANKNETRLSLTSFVLCLLILEKLYPDMLFVFKSLLVFNVMVQTKFWGLNKPSAICSDMTEKPDLTGHEYTVKITFLLESSITLLKYYWMIYI